MAGILDFFGLGDSPQGGILSPSALAPPQTWQNRLGLIGAGLADAGASLEGRPTYNLEHFRQMQMQDQLRQAYAGAASSEPAARAQAYSTILANGGDPSALMKYQASQAMPELLQNMQPTSVAVTPAVNSTNPGAGVQRSAAEAINASPGLQTTPTLQQAAALTGNPELNAEIAPQILNSQIAAAAKLAEPYTLNPGDHRFVGGQDIASVPLNPTPNQPFNPDGTPNKAFQDYEAAKMKAQQAPAWANVDIARQRLESGIPNEDALHDMAVRYVHGDKTAFGALGRNPRAQTAASNMISQVGRELGLKPEQISANQQTFQAGTKAVQAFDTGKQGDIVRSLNVSVSHLETLRELGQALQNGDVRLINAAKQKFAEEFGVPAPTNFDAAKSIVADEVAKGVIGGQSAQSDRETLAASLRRTGSPQAIEGAIGTFQNLLGGQLHGLRQQYKTSTGRDDFNDKLFPSTLSVLDRSPPKVATPNPSGLPRTTDAAIPAQAITYLKSNPSLAAQFDAKYGAGAAKRALGQ